MKKRYTKKEIINEVVETIVGFIAISIMWGVIYYVAYISY